MAKKQRGAFISVEGLDGAGKTSNIRNLGNKFSHGDMPHFIASEYDDSKFCKSIRDSLNNQTPTLDPVAETLGFYLSRIEHTQKILAPYLDSGAHVITDRYYHSTLAYQSIKLPKERVLEVHNIVKDRLREPDLVLFYDIPVSVYEERVRMRGKSLDKIESRGLEYFTNVRANFHELAANDPRIRTIDASAPLEDVFAETQRVIDEFLRTFHENLIQP
ncbi:Thymidylate kinase [compost metagenome]